MPKFSIVSRVSMALFGIVSLALLTMLASYWLSEKADHDALAINVAGSLRWQSYRVGLLSQQQHVEQELTASLNKLTEIWQHPVFKRSQFQQPPIYEEFQKAQANWLALKPAIAAGELTPDQLRIRLTEQVEWLDHLVFLVQQDAESKIQSLRTILIIALIMTALLSLMVMYWLKAKVELPLNELTRAARRIGQGDFTSRVTVQGKDELGVLADTLNKMSDAIGYMYGNLEKRVDEQTQALQHTNTTLQFLYETARNISEQAPGFKEFSTIIERLQQQAQIADLELCLLTEQGNKPYLQIQPKNNQLGACEKHQCSDCLIATSGAKCENDVLVYRYPLNREQHHYGVLVARTDPAEPLAQWQQQLLQSVADQLALALSLEREAEQSRRLVLMQERTVIARELHDSLAQALSYLKIQVTRLNKASQKDDKATIEDVSAELKEGLDAAYRQLRELLTTFRLKIEGEGLLNALQLTVKQLSEQSGIPIRLDYQLMSTPLAPQEEIHLLQIIREASQNAVNHSQGNEVLISLQQQSGESIRLAVEDDGVGIPLTAEKPNHYGLAIMQERSRQLHGNLEIRRREGGGTGVYFSFMPEYLKQKQSA